MNKFKILSIILCLTINSVESSDEKKVFFATNFNEIIDYTPDKAYQKELRKQIKELDLQRAEKEIERLKDECNCTDEISLYNAIKNKQKKAILNKFKKQVRIQNLQKQSLKSKKRSHDFQDIILENKIQVGRFKQIYEASKIAALSPINLVKNNNN